MQVGFSEEQTQVQHSVRRLLQERYGFDVRQRHSTSERGWSEEAWRLYADMGLQGLLIPTDSGGLGQRSEDLLPVMQEMGRALVLEPFFPSSVLASVALSRMKSEAASALLGRAASGEQVLILTGGPLSAPSGTERPLLSMDGPDGWHLNGSARTVLQARDADILVIAAPMSEAGSCGLFTVETRAAGLQRRDIRLVDQRTASDLVFENVQASLIAPPSAQVDAALQRALEVGSAALVAEASGVARAALEVTVGYLGTRQQFGRALSEFQALRHRAADMLVSVTTMEAMAVLAAIAADRPESASARSDLASAKLLAGRHGRSVCEQAIQMHGAIGMTDEYVVGHYLQRMVVLDALLAHEGQLLDYLTATLCAEPQP